MNEPLTAAASTAAQIMAEIEALPSLRIPAVRTIRRWHSRALQSADAAFVLDVSRSIAKNHRLRWVACELVRNHDAAFRSVDAAVLEELGQGMTDWQGVDGFARTLSGPAWLHGHVSDALIHRWAMSADLWWRRAALVSTVALNMHTHGGTGDTKRTLDICRMLAADTEDMVQKAMSWALRELIVHDADAVRLFLTEHDAQLGARIKREVQNKLRTGLKNPSI